MLASLALKLDGSDQLVWACLAQTGAGVDRPGPNVTLQLPHPRRLEQSPVDDYLDVDFQTPLDFYGMGDGRLHANGKVFMLRGVNWYGPAGTSRILEGLDKRPMDDIFADLNFMGFNAVRLLFSAQEWMENAPLFWADAENDFLRLNPVLRGVDYRQMLGIVMQSAARPGILVLFALHLTLSPVLLTLFPLLHPLVFGLLLLFGFDCK